MTGVTESQEPALQVPRPALPAGHGVLPEPAVPECPHGCSTGPGGRTVRGLRRGLLSVPTALQLLSGAACDFLDDRNSFLKRFIR